MTETHDTPRTLIDLFAGCGGGSIGFRLAGFSPVAAIEIDVNAAAAYEANLRVKPLVKNIRRVKGPELLRSAGLNAGECTLLFGCPPCQSFTTLRKAATATSRDRRRNTLYLDYLRLVGSVQPRHIAFENVPGMLSPRWHPHFEALLAGLSHLGYRYTWEEIDAADYGVPQRRRRLLVVASRVTQPVFPRRTHAAEAADGLAAHRTVRDVIGNCEMLAAGTRHASDPYHAARNHTDIALRRLRAIPAGGARADLPEDLQLECHKGHNGHYDIYGRMWWDRPAPTLTSGCTNVTRGRFAHPDQNRAITLREAMALQSFPETTELSGTGDQMALQVGNAIPPLLARRVGDAVIAMEEATRAGVQDGAPARTMGVPHRTSASRSRATSST